MKTGYFNDNKREYIIENMKPYRPLKNFLWNDGAFMEIDQFGCGASKACIDKDFRTIVSDYRLVYIKDEKTGESYCANRNFTDLPFEEFFATVGWGYHTVTSGYKGLKTEFTLLISSQDYVEMHRVRLTNTSKENKRIKLYTYLRPLVNLYGYTASCTKGFYDENAKSLVFYFRAQNIKTRYTDIYYKADYACQSYATTDRHFKGIYNDLNNPVGIQEDKLPCECSVREDVYCGAYQFQIELKAGESKEIYLSVGLSGSDEESKNLGEKYTNKQAFEKELQRLESERELCLKQAQIKTPDEYYNSMVNIWLKRQITLGKTWGRIYGKGFRDLLQDITGFVAFDKEAGRKRLLYTLEHQFLSGNGLRQFDPVVDYPYQDMPIWIPIAVLAYLKESGDLSLLEEVVGYYDSEEKESVFLHVKRSMDYLFTHQGKRGLGLWGGGDWNDALNTGGLQMQGESVWLSIATIKAARDYMEIIKAYPIPSQEELLQDTQNKMHKLMENIEKYGFEEDRYIYAFNDWDEKVGSKDCTEGKHFLNTQTWAVIANVGDSATQENIMDKVEENLSCAYGYVQMKPCYTTPNDRLGRITFNQPGVYENGSVYLHGVMFKIVADCLLQRGDNALKTLEMIKYSNPENANSGVEPYAVSNMYYGPESIAQKGFAPCSWITGSAGWLYRAITEFMLGIQADFVGLKIQPVLPKKWDSVQVKRVFRDAEYDITIMRGTDTKMLVDGKEISGNIVPVFEKGTKHDVIYFTK